MGELQRSLLVPSIYDQLNVLINLKAKITIHGKKKYDKDEFGNILLKHVITSP